MRKYILIIVLVLITIAAHPIDNYETISYRLWDVLSKVGIDVSMTPFTSDMMLMYDEESKINFYKYPISIMSIGDSSIKKIAMEDLSFYGFRLPLILFVEEFHDKSDTSGLRSAMCYELRKMHSETKQFKIVLELEEDKLKEYGFNVSHQCQTKLN